MPLLEPSQEAKRYALFGGPTYYPAGGWDDFIGFFDRVPQAMEYADQPDTEGSTWPEYEFAHIVDMMTMKIVVNRDATLCEISELEWTFLA